MLNINRKNKGFSLIEVIIAMAILGIILIAFLSTFSFGFIQIYSMGHKSQAVAEAQRIMDEIYYYGDQALVSGTAVIDGAYVAPDTNILYATPLDGASLLDKNRIYFSAPQTAGDKKITEATVVTYYRDWKERVELTTIIESTR